MAHSGCDAGKSVSVPQLEEDRFAWWRAREKAARRMEIAAAAHGDILAPLGGTSGVDIPAQLVVR